MVKAILQKILPNSTKQVIASWLGCITREEHEKAIQELETSKTKFKHLYYDAPIALFSISMDGIVIHANDSARLLFRCKKGYLKGKSLFDLIARSEQELSKAKDLFSVICGGKGFQEEEIQMRTCNATEFNAMFSVNIIQNTDGKTIEIIATIQDITARKQAKEKLRTMIRHISHEIRNPLNALINIPTQVEMAKTKQEQQELLALMRGTANTMLVLVNGILDLQKIESGTLKLNCEPFRPKDLIHGTIALFQTTAEQKGIQIIGEVPEYSNIKIFLDLGKLQQILSNLITNAIKFTHEGTITVSAVIKDQLEISVTDTGIGIPIAKQAEIFNEFSQVHGIPTEQKGTGLGLSISRQLASRMSGTMEVRSSMGKGSTFTCTLPC